MEKECKIEFPCRQKESEEMIFAEDGVVSWRGISRKMPANELRVDRQKHVETC